ncbi:MAG: hypothetical protein L3J47_00200 [Sulfurovum sp.]|nr:hypothetical protein [Sulfurovum sp.]
MKLERQQIAYRGPRWRVTGPLERPAEAHAKDTLLRIKPLVRLMSWKTI